MIDVLITDAKSGGYDHNKRYFEDIDQWAQANCPTYLGYHVQDVSDTSYVWDEIASYEFREDKCANWFKLRWL